MLDVLKNQKPWDTGGGGWKLHSRATDLPGAGKHPEGTERERALSSMGVKEVLVIITLDVFIVKFYWPTKMSPKEPLVKEKLSCIYTQICT